METDPARGWTACVLEVPEPLADELAGILGEGCLGSESTSVGSGTSRLRIYCASEAEARGVLERAAVHLRAWAIEVAPTLESVVDERWAERYQKGLKPFPIGTRFLVVPGETPHTERDRIPILLVPGQAFGTGEHPTTRLCVEALERFVRAGSRWLDLGTGSGILAIVAACSGATSVVARDTDPEAVEVAREVVAANRAEDRVRAEIGSAEGAGSDFDGVVANIAAPYFLHAGAQPRSLLRPGGLLLASGLLRSETAEVRRALEAGGLEFLEERVDGEWALLAATRSRE